MFQRRKSGAHAARGSRKSHKSRAVVACEGLEGRQLLTQGLGGMPPFAGLGMSGGYGLGTPPSQVGGFGGDAGGFGRLSATAFGGPGGTGGPGLHGETASGFGSRGAARGFPGKPGGSARGGQGWGPGGGGQGSDPFGPGDVLGANSGSSQATSSPEVQKAQQALQADYAATGTHSPSHASLGAVMDDHEAVAKGTLSGDAADAKLKADSAAVLTSAGYSQDQITKIQADEQTLRDALKAAGIDPANPPGSTSATATAVRQARQAVQADYASASPIHSPTHASLGAVMDDQDAIAKGTLTGDAADAKLKADSAAVLASAGYTQDQITKIQADEQALRDAQKAAGIDPKNPAATTTATATTSTTAAATTTTTSAAQSLATTGTPANVNSPAVSPVMTAGVGVHARGRGMAGPLAHARPGHASALRRSRGHF